jgi:DNA-binding HxlR family transcriptional regulator
VPVNPIAAPKSPAREQDPGRPGEETLASSALADALSAVGDRWTLLIVAALLDHPRRFGDLERELPGISPNVLSGRLQRLEQQGLAVAEPYSERPLRYVYELTESGRALAGPLRLLADWGARNAGGSEPPVHAECGSPLEATWYCSTCQRPVADDEAADLHFA